MQQLYVAILLILAVLGTFGNMLVIAAVILSRKLRHATNMFVLNLSIADLLTCAYVVPVQAVAVFPCDGDLLDHHCDWADDCAERVGH